MKIIEVEQNTNEWLEARKGKITGSKLKDIVVKRGNGKKIGFYQLIADRLAIEEAYIDPRERGHSLEHEALEMFEKQTDLVVDKDVGLCVSDINENIAISPDGLIADDDGKYTSAVEVKCLGSARHIEAVLTDKVPDEYYAQAVQYFVVIDELEVLYFSFYDPRVTAKPFHIVQVTREDVEADVEFYRDYQKDTLKEVEEALAKLAF
jgi:hypothetical protein